MSEIHVIIFTAAAFAMWCFTRYMQLERYNNNPNFVVDWFPSVSLTHQWGEKNCHVSRIKVLKKEHPLDPDYIEFGKEGLFGRKFVDFVIQKKNHRRKMLAIGIHMEEPEFEYHRKRHYFAPGEMSFCWPDLTTCRDLVFWSYVFSDIAIREFGLYVYVAGEYSNAYSEHRITDAMPHLANKAREMLRVEG